MAWYDHLHLILVAPLRLWVNLSSYELSIIFLRNVLYEALFLMVLKTAQVDHICDAIWLSIAHGYNVLQLAILGLWFYME